MKLWKSLLVGFFTYIILTFAANILIVGLAGGLSVYFAQPIMAIITQAFVGMDGFNPVSTEIYGGMVYAITVLPLGDYMGGIGAVLVPIVPGLVAAILAGLFGKSAKNGFFGMLITCVLVSVLPIVLVFVNNTLFDVSVPLVSLVVNNNYLEATFTLVIGVLTGVFWGGVAAMIGNRWD